MTNQRLKQTKLMFVITGLLILSACSTGKTMMSDAMIDISSSQATLDASSQVGQNSTSTCSNLSSLSTIKKGLLIVHKLSLMLLIHLILFRA
ncbi:MAG: hypothetical protein IME94_03060 [Proteobacteria bacterium]|nr:hypothetical protein [Pseudomonadota bacterium]